MEGIKLSAEAKANMIANLELELNARKEKLRAMCEAQCASLQSRLERRVNRIPANKRQMPIIELLAPAEKVEPKPIVTKKAVPAPAAARKTRAAPTNNKPAPKPAPAKPAPKTAARGKKRSSDEISSEDKENALAVKKRARTATSKPAPVAKAPATRTTRAASKQKPAAPAAILSPKTNNARKPAKSTTRPR